MILRRLAQHLKEQNWTAIGIEFVLLVVGVFLGIQVANWNTALADRRVAATYVAAIADDVRADMNEIGHIRDKALARIGASAYLLREAGTSLMAPAIELTQRQDAGVFAGLEHMAIPEVDAPPPESRGRLWSIATDTYMYDASRSAYDALVSSGRIEVLDDPRVVRALREYYYLVDALTGSQLRTIVPMRQKIVDIGIDRGYSLMGTVDERALVERIRTDPALAAALATSREVAAIHLALLTALDRKAQELIRLLEGGGP